MLCNSRLNDLLENEIKEPCEDLMKFVVDSLVDFVPRSFVRKFIQEQANYCGHGTFFPVNYIEKIGQEADSFMERNSFLNPSCFSQRIPSSFLQEFAFERGHFYISESSLVLKLLFIESSFNPFVNLAVEKWYLLPIFIFRIFQKLRKRSILIWRNEPCVVIGRHQVNCFCN